MKKYSLWVLAVLVLLYWVWAVDTWRECWARSGNVVQGLSANGWVCITKE